MLFRSNFKDISKSLDEMAKKYGMSKDGIEKVMHTAFEARRTQELNEKNAVFAEKIKELSALADQYTASSRAAKSQDTAELHKIKAQQTRQEIEKLKAKIKETGNMDQYAIDIGNNFFKMFPELKGIVNSWNGIRNNIMDIMVEGGLYSREEADALLDAAAYVPFYREDQIEQGRGPKELVRSLKVAADKRMKGSEKAVNDILDNMVRWTQYAVSRSVRARSA